MKLETTNEAVQTSGGSNSNSFSIAMNGKAFKVLSDTLYKNKIGSIVRELSCNAYDAHIVVGKKDIPFSIHLPDAFEPWFSVQDSGPGLSPEDIKTVFTVYFESTKDQSNDSIGAFGLGAKTPFSYTGMEAKARAVHSLELSKFSFLKNANADIGKFCRNLSKHENSTIASKAVAIHTALGLAVPEVSVKRYEEIEEKFLQKYPLLQMVNKFEKKSHEPLLDYINAMYNTTSSTTKE